MLRFIKNSRCSIESIENFIIIFHEPGVHAPVTSYLNFIIAPEYCCPIPLRASRAIWYSRILSIGTVVSAVPWIKSAEGCSGVTLRTEGVETGHGIDRGHDCHAPETPGHVCTKRLIIFHPIVALFSGRSDADFFHLRSLSLLIIKICRFGMQKHEGSWL